MAKMATATSAEASSSAGTLSFPRQQNLLHRQPWHAPNGLCTACALLRPLRLPLSLPQPPPPAHALCFSPAQIICSRLKLLVTPQVNVLLAPGAVPGAAAGAAAAGAGAGAGEAAAGAAPGAAAVAAAAGAGAGEAAAGAGAEAQGDQPGQQRGAQDGARGPGPEQRPGARAEAGRGRQHGEAVLDPGRAEEAEVAAAGAGAAGAGGGLRGRGLGVEADGMVVREDFAPNVLKVGRVGLGFLVGWAPLWGHPGGSSAGGWEPKGRCCVRAVGSCAAAVLLLGAGKRLRQVYL